MFISLSFAAKAFVTLIVVTDPFLVAPIFSSLTMTDSQEQKNKTAIKSCFIALILMLVFGILGEKLLDVLGISHAAFGIAGGFLMLLAGIEMVRAKSTGLTSTTNSEEKEATHRHDISVFPLAIPLIAGPGALTSVVMLMNDAEHLGVLAQITVIISIVLAILIVYICMYLSKYIMRILGVTGTNVLTRVFGIILAGLATQNIIKGIISIVKSI